MTNVRRTFPLPGEVPHPTGHPGLVDERFQRPTIFTSAGGLEVDSDTSDDRETDRQTDRRTGTDTERHTDPVTMISG